MVKSNTFPDVTTQVLGETLRYPIALAPVGVQTLFHHDGEKATARAAQREGVTMCMSTASSTSIEDVGEANGDGGRWFQLYWPAERDNDVTISLLQRAKKAGFTALFVTLDTYTVGWRPSDMDNGYNPFIHADNVGVEVGFRDPGFRQKFKERHGVEVEEKKGEAAREWTSTIFPGFSHGWEDVTFLKEYWDGPIVLKGIQSVQDAKMCIEVGVQGIVVSNHGGRQMDGGVSSLGVLPRIVDAVGDKLDIFFDSGVRCGADIVKALALGAKCCLIGRPYVYGLAMGGERGVSHVLKSLVGEMILTMHLGGYPGTSKDILNRDTLVREDAL